MSVQNGLLKHGKFLRLVSLLGTSRPKAVSHLVMLWCNSVEVRAIGWFDYRDIEAIAEWDGEPTAFARAVIESGFIDVKTAKNPPAWSDKAHKYIRQAHNCAPYYEWYEVHDWQDYYPRWFREYMRKKMNRKSWPSYSGANTRLVPNGTKSEAQISAPEAQISAPGANVRQKAQGGTPPLNPPHLFKTHNNSPSPLNIYKYNIAEGSESSSGNGGEVADSVKNESMATEAEAIASKPEPLPAKGPKSVTGALESLAAAFGCDPEKILSGPSLRERILLIVSPSYAASWSSMLSKLQSMKTVEASNVLYDLEEALKEIEESQDPDISEIKGIQRSTNPGGLLWKKMQEILNSYGVKLK